MPWRLLCSPRLTKRVHFEPLGSDMQGWLYGRFVRPLERETGPKPADAGGIGAVDQAPVRYHQRSLEGDPTRSAEATGKSARSMRSRIASAPAARDIDSSVTLGRLLQPGVEISVRPHDPESERVIVEITPRWRSAMAAHGMDWSTDALRARLVGHLVRVRGWLLYDAEPKTKPRMRVRKIPEIGAQRCGKFGQSRRSRCSTRRSNGWRTAE